MYKKNDVFFADISDLQTIFIDMENGVFYILPAFANLVFRFLICGKNVTEIKEKFKDIPLIPSDYESRIDQVIADLIKNDLIVESTECDSCAEPAVNNLIIQEMQENDFISVIEPSNDVQKLLLDDPIHDVSLEGWTPVAK